MPLPNADGPDLSHWNVITGEPIDPRWRLFSHKVSEGKTGRDPLLRERWAWAEAQGFEFRGGYHWLRSDSSIKDQAANFVGGIASVGGFARGVFAQIDWETTKGVALPTSGMAAELADRINQAAGREAAITYLGTWLPDSPLDSDTRAEALEWREENPTAPLWVAFYNTAAGGGWKVCAEWHADLWQWSSNFRHPSIVTPQLGAPPRGFDINHVFAWETLMRLTDQLPAPAPTPIPEEGDDMAKLIIDDPVLKAAFTHDGTPVAPEDIPELEAQGFKRISRDHPYWRENVLHKLGGPAAFEYGKRAAAPPTA